MAVTSDFPLPADDDLTVPEVKLSGVVLRAGAFHLGKYCEEYNNEFMLCRQEMKDARQCIDEGKAVTSCTLDFFRMVKNSCAKEFKNFYHCVDRSSSNYAFKGCCKTRKEFDSCMKYHYSLERPDYGYFCRVKVHKTDRPKPPEEGPLLIKAADLAQKLPPDFEPERPPAKYGYRMPFAN